MKGRVEILVVFPINLRTQFIIGTILHCFHVAAITPLQ